MFIGQNGSLVNIDALTGLTTLGDGLYINLDESLTDVDGLTNIVSIGNVFRVRHNASLSECTTGLSDLLEDMSIDAMIYLNAPGCNSRWEAMGFGIDAEDEAPPLVTGLAAPYPNPTVGAATVAFTLADPAEVWLTLYDALGRRVRTLAEGPQSAGTHAVTLDANLPAGTYVVRFEADGQSWTERVTVVR